MRAKMGNSVPLVLSETMPTSDAASLEMEAAVREDARLVYRISYSVLGNHHDAEDAVQETFLRYFRHRKDWPAIRNRRSWLARVAWRAALDRRRGEPEIPLGDAAEGVSEMKAAGAGPEEIAARREFENGPSCGVPGAKAVVAAGKAAARLHSQRSPGGDRHEVASATGRRFENSEARCDSAGR